MEKKDILSDFVNILQEENCDSFDSCKINELIQFCQTILQKLESNESLTQNEEIFLDYISMVLKILEMKSELRDYELEFIFTFHDYVSKVSKLRMDLYYSLVNFKESLLYSLSQKFVPSKEYPWIKPSGSPSKIPRKDITEKEKLQIKKKEELTDAEIKRLLDKRIEMNVHCDQILERLSQLSSSVSEAIQKFGLNNFPEIVFYLSGFDSDQFNQFRDKFQIIDQTFQSLENDIDAFYDLLTPYFEENSDSYLKKIDESLNGEPFS